MMAQFPLKKRVATALGLAGGLGAFGLAGAMMNGLGSSHPAGAQPVQPAVGANPQPVAAPNQRKPNILLILADDVGWSDIGCYGGEIHTPNIDALAQGGVRFTQFYNSARCCPSRASILTGLHPHQAGFPAMSGILSPNAVTIPEVLRSAGYGTYMVGKWHLNEHNTPVMRGFDEYYGMLGGFNSYWQEHPYYTRLPADHPRREYPPGGFYSTDVFADYSLDFIDQARRTPDKPWFQYLAFNAAHFPLHAYEQDIDKYEAVYAQGWDKIREQRLARQKQMGLVPQDLVLSPRSEVPANWVNVQTGWADKQNPAWDSLPEDRRRDLARRMAVYAATIDRMDRDIGRVIAHLKETGQFDNTLIFFLSDNGACAEWDPWGFDGESGPHNVLHTGADLQKVGGPESYVSYGSGWANASNTPWRLYKHYGEEGGIAAPFIVHWPAGMPRHGELDTRLGYITDLMPTCLEAAGASYPRQFNGHDIMPEEGISLLPALHGVPAQPRTIFMEHEGNRAVREVQWKLVALDKKPWELYDMSTDRTEMHDLAAQHPEIVRRLEQAWDDWAERCNVRPRGAANAQQAVDTPQIANQPLTITCDVEPQARDGVILAQGGNRYGYALVLRDGKLIFCVRTGPEKLTSIAGDAPATGRFSIEAKLNRDGAMQLAINNHPIAEGRAPGLIPAQPMDGLSINGDTLSAVGDYAPPHSLRGKVENVRVNTGQTEAGQADE